MDEAIENLREISNHLSPHILSNFEYNQLLGKSTNNSLRR